MMDLERNINGENFREIKPCYIKKKECFISLACIALFTGVFALIFGISFIPYINNMFSKISKIPFIQILLKISFSSAGGTVPVVVVLLGVGVNAWKNRNRENLLGNGNSEDLRENFLGSLGSPELMTLFRKEMGSLDDLQLVIHIVSFSNNPNLKLVSKLFQTAWREVKGELIIGMNNYSEIEKIPGNLQHVIISSCKKSNKEKFYMDKKFFLWFYENCLNASRVTIRSFLLSRIFKEDVITYPKEPISKIDHLLNELEHLQILTCSIDIFPDIFSQEFPPRWLAEKLRVIRFYISSKMIDFDETLDNYGKNSFILELTSRKVQEVAFLKFVPQKPSLPNLEILEIHGLNKNFNINIINKILVDFRNLLKNERHPLSQISCTIKKVKKVENQVVICLEQDDLFLKMKFYF